MKINRSIEYAARLMVSLARRYGQAPANAETLSESENVPVDYINQILLKLRRAGLVDSRRGTAGGYSLSREPGAITLGAVVRAVEGPILEDVCGRYVGGKLDCRHQGSCGISGVWQGLGSMIENYLDGLTLAELVAQGQAKTRKKADLSIRC